MVFEVEVQEVSVAVVAELEVWVSVAGFVVEVWRLPSDLRAYLRIQTVAVVVEEVSVAVAVEVFAVAAEVVSAAVAEVWEPV